MSERSHSSRLAGASSAYLRSAAEQSIDWYPWGDEPFRRAREEGKPVLLDIGASWCHWCHVMDEGTYADPEVAALLAREYIAVKVDRDENPEVDRRYQQQVHALTGEGGWPLTAFLTADGTAFLGGTYFPPTDGHGRPGFRRVLSEVARISREEPARVAQNTAAMREALGRLSSRRAPGPVPLEQFATTVVGELAAGFDPVHGGFGGAPKFPHPTAVDLLLWADFHGVPGCADRARETLEGMADGGMYDHVGGGFHRYSVDEGWHIPHFEKMGVDNAELLGSYVSGFQRFGDPRFAEVVRGTVGWVSDVLGDRDGGWGASQDADNAPGDDGDYFTWTRAELRGALGPEEFRFASRLFGIDTDGRMPHAPERNVLYRMLPVAEAANGCGTSRTPEELFAATLRALRVARDRRPVPTVDRALYASINGRFVGSLARAGLALGERSWIESARRAADRFLAAGPSDERGMPHRLVSGRGIGYGLLDDQAAFALGLVELAGATAESKYIDRARGLLELIDREFRGEDGLLRDVAPALYDGPTVGGPLDASYPLEDMPHLSPGAAVALALRKLDALLHDERWSARATGLVTSASARLGGAGLFAAGTAVAVGLLSTEPKTVVVEGSGERAQALLRRARTSYHPLSFVFEGPPPVPFGIPGTVPAPDARPRALVCSGTSCAPPVSTEDELVRLLAPERSGR